LRCDRPQRSGPTQKAIGPLVELGLKAKSKGVKVRYCRDIRYGWIDGSGSGDQGMRNLGSLASRPRWEDARFKRAEIAQGRVAFQKRGKI